MSMYVQPVAHDAESDTITMLAKDVLQVQPECWLDELATCGYRIVDVHPLTGPAHVLFIGPHHVHAPYLVALQHRNEIQPLNWFLCTTDPTGVFADCTDDTMPF